ncbi:hypothetical protein [Halobacillus yeomjeoni]|uniref:Uncharacterized protein n=1 Tax=Halobacillus yeomjeoni TaxID=311194 RepID=A0A931MWF5_9BACI|nr:hypothetical protein [Halobacillus yeomjeoni]MBH0231314.1 hypothetical protein [Halobacillus yeomjeoni]
MKKALFGLLVFGLILAFSAGSVSAKYYKDSDKTVSVNTGQNLSYDYDTAETSFELQEEAHDYLTDTSGAEVDHYYIWVEVDGQKVLAVDPARGMY